MHSWKIAFGISLILGVGIGGYLFAERVITPRKDRQPTAEKAEKPLPTGKNQTVSQPPIKTNILPTAIPLNSADTEYAASHPGWQRYTTDSLEFRVFHENKNLKAVQVLARQENVITADFFKSFLAEIAGGDSLKVLSTENRDGYHIEKGKVGEKLEVVVYRKKTAREIRALVVAYL